jgi:hypothetical protein
MVGHSCLCVKLITNFLESSSFHMYMFLTNIQICPFVEDFISIIRLYCCNAMNHISIILYQFSSQF